MKYKIFGMIRQSIVLGVILTGCNLITPEPVAENNILDGPMEGLSKEQASQFFQGDTDFGTTFTSETGLGPIFVATSCVSCHAGDGKGHPFTTLTRFGQSDTTGNKFLDQGGPQLHNRAIPGNTAEIIPPGASFSNFLPPAVTGLGLLAALTDNQILSNSDPDDINGDGISGRPNYITPPDYFMTFDIHTPKNGRFIGRFGKKAAAITLQHQTVNAYNEDMGITSDFSMIDPINYQVSEQSTDRVPDPEVSASVVNNVVFYLRTLKEPLRRNADNSDVMAGEQIFNTINCVGCHISLMTTGDSDISVLANRSFAPYTDLLLHDMGPGLDDNYTEGIAETWEWRTPPLWGLGLSKDSQGGEYFLLHDGRASSIEEAIVMHGGEAEQSKLGFMALSESEKKQILQFLESL